MAYIVLRNLGRGLPAYTEGQVIEHEEDGAMLAKRGLAEVYDPKVHRKAKLQAKPAKPAISEAKPTELKGEAKK